MSRYIFLETLVPFLLSVGILTVTALMSKIIKIIELMVTHGVGGSFILWFIASILPSFLIYTIPISFLIAVLIAFTRLSSDSEVTAMKASGISLFRMARPVLLLASLAYFATVACTLYLFPWGNLNLKSLLFDIARTKLVSGIEEKTFYDRFKGMVLYIDHLSPKTGEMDGIFISQGGAKGESTLFFAQRGEFAPSSEEFTVYLKLYNGTIHGKTEGNGAYHIADFSTYTLELNIPGGEPEDRISKTNRELYVGELMSKIQKTKALNENAGPYMIDLHKRFALPVSVFVFAVVGIPLGIQRVRSARFTGFSVALGVVLVYYVLSTAFEALGENSVINPVFAVWGSDVIFLVAGIYIFYRAAKDKPVDLSIIKGLFVKPFRGKKDDGKDEGGEAEE